MIHPMEAGFSTGPMLMSNTPQMADHKIAGCVRRTTCHQTISKLSLLLIRADASYTGPPITPRMRNARYGEMVHSGVYERFGADVTKITLGKSRQPSSRSSRVDRGGRVTILAGMLNDPLQIPNSEAIRQLNDARYINLREISEPDKRVFNAVRIVVEEAIVNEAAVVVSERPELARVLADARPHRIGRGMQDVLSIVETLSGLSSNRGTCWV